MAFVEQRFVGDQTDFAQLGICWKCAHKTLGASTCDAFPESIPDAIILGEFDHHKPFAGDSGIQFEQVPGSDGA